MSLSMTSADDPLSGSISGRCYVFPYWNKNGGLSRPPFLFQLQVLKPYAAFAFAVYPLPMCWSRNLSMAL